MTSKEDIEALLSNATDRERTQLAEILDIKLESSWAANSSKPLVKQLYWKYQTPLGFITRDPTFEEFCVDVAGHLKMGGLATQDISCWVLLQRILLNLFQSLYDKLPVGERQRLVADVLKEEIESGQLSLDGRDWSAMSAGVILKMVQQLGGFTIYKVTLIVVNHLAKVLIGRGLSLAMNVMVVRTLSIALGPVGWALMAWGLNDLFGTNWKRIVPATLFIYCIHERLLNERNG